MTVLLIDGVGNVREYEIPRFMRTILVPQPVHYIATIGASESFDAPPIARFDLSDEPSYPPVYRQVLKP